MLGSFYSGNLTVYGFSFSGELFSDAMDIDPEWAFDHNSQSVQLPRKTVWIRPWSSWGYLEKWRSFSIFWTGYWGDIKDSGERISFGEFERVHQGRSGRGAQPGRTGVVWILFVRGKDRQPYAVSNSGIGAGWAIFANLSSVFKGGQVSERGIFCHLPSHVYLPGRQFLPQASG